MSDLIDAVKDELEGEPSAARAMKVLSQAEELGWTENPYVSLVVRLTKDDALPFFARWDLTLGKEGKRSWRFQGARASNGQPLAYGDISTYLQDPDVIHPDPPTSPDDDTDEVFRTALGALSALGPTYHPEPVTADGEDPGQARAGAPNVPARRTKESASLSAGWGALL